MFLSNLSDDDTNDQAFQEIANNITVGYQVKELRYAGREGSAVTLNDAGIFTNTALFISTPVELVATFNQDVAFSSFTAAVSNNNPSSTTDANYGALDHVLTKNGEPAIAFVDNTLTVVTDTVAVDGVTFTCVNTIADETIEFLYDIDPIIMCQNLADAMSSVPARNFYAIPLDDGGTIKTRIIHPDISGNAKPITYVGTIAGDASLTGANSTVVSINASDISLQNTDAILYTFSGIVQLTEADTLDSRDIKSLADQTITSSVTGTPSAADPDEFTTDSTASGFTDFIDEKVIFDTRSYRRGEVYSFGFMLLYKDGTTSFVYHIPGNDKAETALGKHYPSTAPYQNTDGSSGDLGTYLSETPYPLDQYFPGNTAGDDVTTATTRNVRHHVMPNPNQEPHFRDLGGGAAIIRAMGVNFTLNPLFLIPASIKESVQDIIFVRERRNVATNKSVLASGLINRMVETAINLDSDGGVDGGTTVDGVKPHYVLQEMPFFNNCGNMAQSRSGTFDKTDGNADRGICWPGASIAEATLPNDLWSDGNRLDTKVRGDRAFFHCPESILSADTGVNAIDMTTAIMKPWLKIAGDFKVVSNAKGEFEGAGGLDEMTKWPFSDMHGSYTSYDHTYSYDDAANDRRVVAAAERVPGNRYNDALSPDAKVPNKSTCASTQGGWEVKVSHKTVAISNADPYDYDPAHEFITGGSDELQLKHEPWIGNKASSCISKCKDDARRNNVERIGGGDLNTGSVGDISNHLYSVELEQASQYGQIGVASYMPIGRFDVNVDGPYLDIYSGDTFITKFSFNTGSVALHKPYRRTSGTSRHTSSATDSQRGYGLQSNKAAGWDLRACHYYFVESDINTYYRHRPEDEEKQDYFPNESNPKTNLSSFFAWQGNINAYNGLYSYENTLKEFYIKGSTQQVVTSFESRTIYSEQALSDSVVDSYRSFLVNNYYDLPSHTGPIWDSFVHANTLYLHTPKSCWRTFAEPAATLSGGNISDVVLGTGALFARPSSEVLTTEGGYGGSISQYGGTHTAMGYIYPDVLQGKVFALALSSGGPILKDLSLEGMYTFFHKNMDVDIIRDNGVINLSDVTTDGAHMIDNPYQGTGFLGGYDYKLKRAWIVKQGGFAISYSVLMQSWSSFHDYIPEVIIPFDNRVFFLRNTVGDTTDMWEMNEGAKATYFGTTHNSELEISVPTPVARTFNNQIQAVDITSRANVKQRDAFWNTMNVWTDRQNTGTYTFVPGNTFNPTKVEGETFYKFRNDEYRLAVPRDSVKDNGGDIFDLDNIYTPQGGTLSPDADYAFRERIKGDYAHFAYVYDNVDDNVFVLREIKTIFEQNFR